MWEVIDIGIKKSTRNKEQSSKMSRIQNNEKSVQKIQSVGQTKNTVEVLSVDGQESQGKTFPLRLLETEEVSNDNFDRQPTKGKIDTIVDTIELKSEKNFKLKTSEEMKKEE